MKFNLPAGPLVPLAVAPKAKPSDELSAAFSARDTWSSITTDLVKAAMAKLVRKHEAKARKGASKTQVAITLKLRNPEWSDAEVARQTPCSPSLLSDSGEYQRNAEAVLRSLRKSTAMAKRRASTDGRTGELVISEETATDD